MLRQLILYITFSLFVLTGCVPVTPDQGANQNLATVPVERPSVSSTPPVPPTSWKLVDLHNPAVPDLLAAEGNMYHLDASWQVAKIDYLYQWEDRYGGTEFDLQTITRQGDNYENAGASILAQAVQALLQNINQLHATQNSLVLHSDALHDRPHWSVELTGTDGQHLLLYSSEDEDPSLWNVLYNGRLYAQYNGGIGSALAELFTGEGPSVFHFYNGSKSIGFSTRTLPPQLHEGFWGLLPIADGFHYRLNTTTHSLEGYIDERGSIGRLGITAMGEIEKTEQITLTLEDGTLVSCAIEESITNDSTGFIAEFASGVIWKFSCDLPATLTSITVPYGIRVTFATSSGEQVSTEGELWGFIQADERPYIPLPEEMRTMLNTHPAAQDLLTDHTVLTTSYGGGYISNEDPRVDSIGGRALLIGELFVNGRPMRYTVTTRFVIKDGITTHWDLDRAALESVVADIGSHPLTARVFTAAPTTILNMWYALQSEPVEVDGNLIYPYSIKLSNCAGVPGKSLPNADEPLRMFGFDSDVHFGQDDFVLIDNKAFVAELDLFPGREEQRDLMPVLMPAIFDTGEQRPFEKISITQSDETILSLFIPQDATEAEKAVYNQIIEVMPVKTEQFYLTARLHGMTFVVTDEGAMEVRACGS